MNFVIIAAFTVAALSIFAIANDRNESTGSRLLLRSVGVLLVINVVARAAQVIGGFTS